MDDETKLVVTGEHWQETLKRHIEALAPEGTRWFFSVVERPGCYESLSNIEREERVEHLLRLAELQSSTLPKPEHKLEALAVDLSALVIRLSADVQMFRDRLAAIETARDIENDQHEEDRDAAIGFGEQIEKLERSFSVVSNILAEVERGIKARTAKVDDWYGELEHRLATLQTAELGRIWRFVSRGFELLADQVGVAGASFVRGVKEETKR